jgi:hypothetical protein
VADLDPARCGLAVGVGGADGVEDAGAADLEGRDGAESGAGVGVADEELGGVGRPELGADGPEVLGGERGSLRSDQPAVRCHREAVDE